MFERWGRFVARRRWAVLLVSLLAFAVGLPLSRGASDRLTAGRWIGEGAEAFTADTALSDQFGRTGTNHSLHFSDPSGGMLPIDPAFIVAVDETVSAFLSDPSVASALTYGTTGKSAVGSLPISKDGRSGLAEAQDSPTDDHKRSLEPFSCQIRHREFPTQTASPASP